ncbi:UNVERIFIED_CONTAM: hypothetical protein Scaly_3145200 [Sesamum calycinum]|uniref:Retrotransposon gag domain-containing protein n=1 Tax=Sesamum calycinum TaxID=2727403 RepID=A0AAW2JI43_9LAMI
MHFRAKKLRYVVSLFEKDALDWWETIPESKNRPITLTWNDFLKEFADKYTPPVYRNRKVEFLELKKNELSVAGYELQFVRLSKYAPEEVGTNELKRDRFEGELRLEIQEKIAIKPPSYGALLQAALRAEETSLERSSTEAKQKKLTGNLNPIPGQSGAVSFKGFGLQKDFGGRQGPTRSFSGRSIPSCANCGRRHTGECWGAQPIVRYRCHQPGHIVRDALHGEIMPGDLRFQGLVVWGKTRNELEVTGEVNGQMKTVYGGKKVIPNCLISAVTAFNLIKGGCEAYLANVRDTTKVRPSVSDVPIVREFPDMFPENYLGYHLIEK